MIEKKEKLRKLELEERYLISVGKIEEAKKKAVEVDNLLIELLKGDCV